jgi:hypothetical protein
MKKNYATQNPLKVSLLLLRISIFIVFFMWALDKFINPSHTAAVFSTFYFYDGLSVNLAYGIGAAQFLLLFTFISGIKKKFSYGLIFFIHLVSTLSSYERYLDPWAGANLLFFAAWPMLAAIAALYLLREEDTLLTFRY